MKDRMKGTLALLLGTTIWGTAFIAQSVGMDHIGPFTFQACRCGLAVVFLIMLTFIFERKSGIKAIAARWRNVKLWKSGIVCGLALFVAASLQQVGLVQTDAGKAGFITAMYIVLVPMLGIFLGKKPGKMAVLSVVLAVIGLYLLSCMNASGINTGDILIMGCAVAFSVQIMIVDRIAGSVDGLRLNCVQALVTTLLSLPFVFFSEQPTLGAIGTSFFPIAYAGILSMGVAYSLQIVGQKHLEPTSASLIMSLESVFAALSGWLILKETMTPWELTGCALVFSGVILSQIPDERLAIPFRKKVSV